MSDANRRFFLQIALVVFGLTFIFGIYGGGIVWPSGWAWGQGHSHYLMMIIGVYATLGVFLIIASRNPEAHRSLIWFTCTQGSWRLSPSATQRNAVICWEMCPRSCSQRSSLQY